MNTITKLRRAIADWLHPGLSASVVKTFEDDLTEREELLEIAQRTIAELRSQVTALTQRASALEKEATSLRQHLIEAANAVSNTTARNNTLQRALGCAALYVRDALDEAKEYADRLVPTSKKKTGAVATVAAVESDLLIVESALSGTPKAEEPVKVAA